MDEAAIDVAKALARLLELTIFELRRVASVLSDAAADAALRRSLDPRDQLQASGVGYGGLSMATAQKLEQAAADPLSRVAAKPTPPISLKPGTRLVREWRGVTPHGPDAVTGVIGNVRASLED
jgi:hypothetical protein